MQNTTLNLYPTTNPSTAKISTVDLQHQLYLKMKSKPQDLAADLELWEILKTKFEKPKDVDPPEGGEMGEKIKINFTAPTLIFPGIEAHDPFLIVDKPDTGLIYLNNKNDKQVMYFVKIVKFCEATLKKVLKEVKLRIFQNELWKKPPLLGELDLDIMKAYEREIIKRLRHHQMSKRFKMSLMGKMSFFLRLQISQSARGIFINQSKYALEMLKKYGLDQCDPVDIPMVERLKLDEDPNRTLVDLTRYRGMVESLMYLTASRADLVFVVCMCAWYQAKPTKKHLTTVKRVFRYLKRTINMGPWYQKDTGFDLTAFADAAYAGGQDSRKSTSGSVQFLGEKLILCIRSQLTDYEFYYNKIPLYCDSQSVIALSCNTVQHSRTKHIAVRYHFIKEQVENEIVELYFIKTTYQLADIFTKALARERFKFLIKRLGMQSITPEELKHLAESDEDEE
ncbi:retrovirus-related pol polyprotein from transposon TNT 1-94 [Tanacetum coccineum]|uniref:Retrovirus-related pol polyprotein from transposon TNT 1-94 n=1 Tax=Tanacetum coccineum TaxID=301880 RepID=A0ABQ4YJ73_9ASTR